MTEKLSERRLAENQVIFREANEQVTRGLELLKEVAKSEGHVALVPDENVPLHFYCECSDENCRQRIVLKPNEYTELHQNSSQFVILPGHNVSSIERTVFSNENFIVVEKYNTPPPSTGKLNPTDLDHSNI